MSLQLAFDNSYVRELEGFYVPWEGEAVPEPSVVRLNDELARLLDIDPKMWKSSEGAAILVGSAMPDGASPVAQAYAGHQFGNFSPQLGDGRALLIGEILDNDGNRLDIQLKGSGRTPFSRGGDGKAVLGPVLREYLIGEAMHALHIPTTRALSAATTGETIMRERPLPGAVLARVASSHIRVGTFQFFAARGEQEKVRQLADYAIARHYPELADSPNPYLALLEVVCQKQASLIAKWMAVGFVHGVMNTDNMTISGETIDYGPCAFIDSYDPKAVYSSIDTQGRYAYGNQPAIAQWNLARLAETLLPLIDDEMDTAVEIATRTVNGFGNQYVAFWLTEMRAKLGLESTADGDQELIEDLFALLEEQSVDFTQFFRSLSQAIVGEPVSTLALFEESARIEEWLQKWQRRLEAESADFAARAAAMNKVNPIYIPRNHKVEEALQAAVVGDLSSFDKLLGILADPYTERDELEDFARPAPESFGSYVTFCGT